MLAILIQEVDAILIIQIEWKHCFGLLTWYYQHTNLLLLITIIINCAWVVIVTGLFLPEIV